MVCLVEACNNRSICFEPPIPCPCPCPFPFPASILPLTLPLLLPPLPARGRNCAASPTAGGVCPCPCVCGVTIDSAPPLSPEPQPQTLLSPARTPDSLHPVSRSIRSRMAMTSRCSRGSANTSATMARDRIDTLATPRSAVCATIPHTWCAWCSCAVRMSGVLCGDTGCICASRHCAVW